MRELSDEGRIVLEKRGEGLNPRAVYLAPFFVAERRCADRLRDCWRRARSQALLTLGERSISWRRSSTSDSVRNRGNR